MMGSFITYSQSHESADYTSFVSNETVFIHANTTTFVSGETLLYKLYCLNALDSKMTNISKIAYVELVGTDKKTIFRHKHFLENGTGQGDFFLSPTLPTGNYKLIAYTNWMLNKTNSKFHELDVFIINPFETGITTDIKNKTASNNEDTANIQKQHTLTESNNKAFKLSLNQKTFKNRELVSLQINALTDQRDGHYSISVRKIDDLPKKEQPTTVVFSRKESEAALENPKDKNQLILPELRGELISGSLSSKVNSISVQNRTVALSIPGKTLAFYLVKTNQAGKFHFNLENAYSNSDITIQVMGDDRENFSVSLDQPNRINYNALMFDNNTTLSSQLKASIEQRSIATQIENAYYNKKTDSLVNNQNYKPFYSPLGKDYILDDYVRFPTLKETAIEVIPEMSFTKNNNVYALHLKDYVSRNLTEPTLVLVDGLLIQDINELFDYKMENIYKVTVIPGGYYYGSDVFNGIINFTTKNQDYVSKSKGEYILKPDLIRSVVAKKYFSPDYSISNSLERIPDYRYQLLWNPNLVLPDKENSVSFYTSDVSGTFEIVLEGFTAGGIPLSLREIIEIK